MSLPWKVEEGSRNHRTYQSVMWGLFVLLVLLAPFVFWQTRTFELGENTFTVGLINLNLGVVYVVAVLSLSVLVGFSGQISLGNSFFMGIGGYLTAVFVQDFDWPWLVTLLIVIPVTFLVGMAIGVPALRIRGLYLALVTLGLGAVFPSFVRLQQIQDYTGGSNGKRISSDLEVPGWLPLDGIASAIQSIPGIGTLFGSGGLRGRDADDVFLFFLLVVMAALVFWATKNLRYSRPGRAIIAIRDNEIGAAVSGVNLPLYKTLTFGFSAAIAGVAGTMYAMAIAFVAPDVFGLNLAIFLIVGLVVGGVGTLSGAVVGGLVIVFIPHWASQVEAVPGVAAEWLRGPTGPFVLGLLLIVLTFVLPGGVIYATRKVRGRFIQVVPRPPVSPAAEDRIDEEGAETMLDSRERDKVPGS